MHQQESVNEEETSLTLRSALEALDSCFHFVFFGALDYDRGTPFDELADAEDTGLTMVDQNIKLDAMIRIFLNEDIEISRRNRQRSGYEDVNLLEKDPPLLPVHGQEVTHIVHCRQLQTWDCGITCVQMILRWLRNNDNSCSLHDYGGSMPLTAKEIQERHQLQKAIATNSIWTIDLIMILDKILSRQFVLHTTSTCSEYPSQQTSYLFSSRKLGVDETYQRFNYYKKTFREDQNRVKQLFHSAHDRSLPMVQMSNLGFDTVVDLITRGDVIAMALIDNNVLRRFEEEPDLDWDGTYRYEPSLMTFSGHYVVLCGISHEKADLENAKGIEAEEIGDLESAKDDTSYCIVVKDPGNSASVDLIAPKLMEAAWKAKGTDDDIVFIRSFPDAPNTSL
jgi:hypothetical protein